MTNQPLIQMEDVSKHYQRGVETVHAVQDISLTINRGEYVGIIGHSGSGKTTLLNLIGCLDRPSGGTITVNGHRIENAPERELNRMRQTTIGFVFQQFFLIPTLTVQENVELPLLFNRGTHTRRVVELLDMVGLSSRLHHRPGQLSGGEMQRVAIARSLISSPPILLADEPTGNLDSRNAGAIMALFERLNEEGTTIVMVTHNHEFARRCGRTIHIEDGRINT